MDTPAPGNTGTSGPPATAPAQVNTGGASKIQHTRPGIGPGVPAPSIGAAAAPPTAAPLASGAAAPPKNTAFGKDRRHEDAWARTPNTTGAGAIHVKSFHCKLTEDALTYMDQTINEWLDAHPQYEVKFVNSAIGTLTGKLKEPALICQVWV